MIKITVIEDSPAAKKRIVDSVANKGIGALQWISSPPFFDTKVALAIKDFGPDLIILDLLLDKDIESGFRVLRQLKSDPNLKEVPVVVLSKFIKPDHADRNKLRAEALGATKALPKMPKLPNLLSLIPEGK